MDAAQGPLNGRSIIERARDAVGEGYRRQVLEGRVYAQLGRGPLVPHRQSVALRRTGVAKRTMNRKTLMGRLAAAFLKPGTRIRVRRADGVIQAGWLLGRRSGDRFMVEGPGGERKLLSFAELLGLNLGILPLGSPARVLRSNGALDEGWVLKAVEEDKLWVEKPQVGRKALSAEQYLLHNLRALAVLAGLAANQTAIPFAVPAGTPCRVRRSTGEVDHDWHVLGRDADQVVCRKRVPQGEIRKAVKELEWIADNGELVPLGTAVSLPGDTQEWTPVRYAEGQWDVLSVSGHRRVDAAELLANNRLAMPMVSAKPPRVPERLGSYVVGEPLGEGAFGTVFKGEGPDGAVAVKLAKPNGPDIAGGHTWWAFDAIGMRMGLGESGFEALDPNEVLEHEARVSAQLNDKSFACLLEQGDWDGRRYLVYRYVHGRSLREVLDGREGIPMAVWVDVGRALERVQHVLAFHGDLKPENILLGPAGATILDPTAGCYQTGPTRRVLTTPAYNPLLVADDKPALALMIVESFLGMPLLSDRAAFPRVRTTERLDAWIAQVESDGRGPGCRKLLHVPRLTEATLLVTEDLERVLLRALSLRYVDGTLDLAEPYSAWSEFLSDLEEAIG